MADRPCPKWFTHAQEADNCGISSISVATNIPYREVFRVAQRVCRGDLKRKCDKFRGLYEWEVIEILTRLGFSPKWTTGKIGSRQLGTGILRLIYNKGKKNEVHHAIASVRGKIVVSSDDVAASQTLFDLEKSHIRIRKR